MIDPIGGRAASVARVPNMSAPVISMFRGMCKTWSRQAAVK
jgi:hypothetical protein